MTNHIAVSPQQLQDRLKTKHERERLHKSFHYDGYVKSFARWAAFYGWLIGAGVSTGWIYLATYQDPVPITGWILAALASLFGFGLAGAVGIFALWHRADEFREFMNEYTLDEYGQLVAPEPAQVAPRQAPLNGQAYELERQGKTVIYGKTQFYFSGRQLDVMLQWVREGHAGIRRDPSPEGPDLKSIGIKGADYSRAHTALKGRELIDASSRWTDKGIQWLELE